MAKKKEEQIEERKALTPSEYWEWRTTIAEMNAAKAKQELNEARLKILQKDVELMQGQVLLHAATHLRVAREENDGAKSEYFRFKKQLEERLGVTLENKAIDDLTFEIRDLSEPAIPTN